MHQELISLFYILAGIAVAILLGGAAMWILHYGESLEKKLDLKFESVPNQHLRQQCSVVVEKKVVTLSNEGDEVPVTLGWNFPAEVIGYAKIELDEETNYLITHMNLENSIDVKGMFPSIGGVIEETNEEGEIVKFKLRNVALCTVGNIDPTIKAL